MISRNELRPLKAKLLNYCSENDLFQDYNIEDTFDIIAERFITMNIEKYEKEIDQVLPKRKFQKFKNMTYSSRVIKNLEDIQEYNEMLEHYEFLSFISYYLRDNFNDEWITWRVNNIFPEYLHKSLQQVLLRSIEQYKKTARRKEILSKTGKVIGTIAFSPLLILGAIAKASITESSSTSSANKTTRYYYCKYCGHADKDPSRLTSAFCLQRTRMNEYITSKHTPLFHQIYEGGEKSEYICKHCGKSFNSFEKLVNNTCVTRYRMNANISNSLYRVAMSHCEPIL